MIPSHIRLLRLSFFSQTLKISQKSFILTLDVASFMHAVHGTRLVFQFIAFWKLGLFRFIWFFARV